MKRTALLAIALVFLLAACTAAVSSSPPALSPDGSGGMGGMDGMDGGDAGASGFGARGDAADVDRTIDIQLQDSLAFEPPRLNAAAGETISFRVTNAGATDHEFVLGDEAAQQEHEAAMGAGASSQMSEDNYLAVAPGETRSLLWTFTEPGTVMYGCHVPGHYAGGMVGSIMVM